MPEWFVGVVAIFQFAAGAYCGFMIGHKRGRALTPNDYILRDVARQRDQLMRERDEATAAASRIAMSHMQLELELLRLRNAMQPGASGRPN